MPFYMGEGKVGEKLESPKLRPAAWPRTPMPGVSKGVTVAGIGLGVVGLFVGLVALNIGVGLSILVAVMLLLACLLIPWGVWAVRSIRAHIVVSWTRLRQYERIVEQLEQEQGRVTSLSRTLGAVAPLLRTVHLEVTNVIRKSGDVLLVIEKKRWPELNIGDKVMVMDVGTGDVLGEFEISECSDARYLARELDVRDPLWWGYWHTFAESRTHVPKGHDVIALPRACCGLDVEGWVRWGYGYSTVSQPLSE